MVPFKNHNLKPVTEEEMLQILDEIKTSYKYGPVMKLGDYWTDSPSVFFYNGRWYMYFIAISKDTKTSGYETHLAVSDDLLNWKKIDTIFKRNDKNHWDSKQCAGYVAFMDINWGGSNEIQKVNGKYYITYLGGNSDGYEPDPLFMGQAYSDTPTSEFTRFENPILRPDDKDARAKEQKTLYRSFLFEDKNKITGHKYVNIYNGKAEDGERIFAAVSNDGENWERYGDGPIIDDIKEHEGHRISGDAQIVKIGDIYVMFYFKLTNHAFESFACSRDLVNWTRWEGKPIIESSEDWDNVAAHKPWVIKHNGVVYHFYCACNDKGERFIALATSKDFKK